MKRRLRIRLIDVMAVGAIALYAYGKAQNRPPRVDAPAFARQVDLSPLYRRAVQADGRLRSFESHAKTYMRYVSGSRRIHGQPYGFTYLDMILRPDQYTDADVIYIKKKVVRKQIGETLLGAARVDQAWADRFLKTGMIAPKLIREPAVLALLDTLGRDLIRTAKQVNAISSALHVAQPETLLRELRAVTPQDWTGDTAWISLADVVGDAAMPPDAAHAGVANAPPVSGIDPELQTALAKTWTKLATAWRDEDAAAVNVQLAKLADLFAVAAGGEYPSTGRLAMESWYFRSKSMTWVWLIYLASVVPLLMSVIYKWDRARWIGMVMFFLAFAAHTASVGIRWYISGRWPNANMFEAVTTSAWFGGVLAMILEWVTRRTAFRNLFALGSAVASMGALMAVYFLPADLDSGISNKMAALNDVWLYIHTNMIIASYALIALAAVTGVLQLRHRWCTQWDEGRMSKSRLAALPVALVALNWAVYKLIMAAVDPAQRGLHALSGADLSAAWSGPGGMGEALGYLLGSRVVVAPVLVGSVMLLLFEFVEARRRVASGAKIERAASGGASAVMLASSAHPFLKQDRPTQGQVFDGATMVLMELAFITLWTGIVMGAIWADHSWGRPWGWDAKEVFALNTFFIFLILVHVRLKVRDKAFWTAVLAVTGFEVMMFNWIVINFIVVGLHSYA